MALSLENKGVSSLSQPHQRPLGSSRNGFILLEALVAMSLMVGAWMALLQSYQRLQWKLMEQEQTRTRLAKEWNTSEFSFVGKVVASESSRMPSGSRTVHAPAQPASKVER